MAGRQLYLHAHDLSAGVFFSAGDHELQIWPVRGRQVPYAYYLLGLTTLSVVTNEITAPDQVWQVGIDRTEEILLGAMVALLVSTISVASFRPRRIRRGQPRKPRDDWRTGVHSNRSIRAGGRIVRQSGRNPADISGATIGSQESAASRINGEHLFAARLSNYNAFLVSLLSLFQGALLLTHWRRIDATIVEHLRTELALLSKAISKEINILSAPHRPGEKLPPGSLRDVFAVFIKKIEELREQGFFATQPLEKAIVFGTHFAALRSLRDELINIRNLAEGLRHKEASRQRCQAFALKGRWNWLR